MSEIPAVDVVVRAFTVVFLSLALSVVAGGLLFASTAYGSGGERAIVIGSADNGNEGNNLKATLEGFGLQVDRAADVPADLTAYQSVWYVEAYAGLGAEEEDSLVDYSKLGGNLYLTGERPCCETLNASIQRLLDRTLKDTNVQVGGLGDIDGPFAFNSGVTDYVATVPNFLVDFVPHSPGGMQGIGGVNSANVLARSSTTPVGAVWAEKDMVANTGRIALLMDIDWLNDPERTPIVENLANFLSGGRLCGAATDGLTWTAGPANCSAINTPTTASWTASSVAGPAPDLQAVATGATADCTSSKAGKSTTLVCRLTDAEPTAARLTVTAVGTEGTITRRYRIRPKNDSRNVPAPFALDSNWWDWPDSDADGLPDNWETNGVWVKNELLDLPGRGAEPDHKDLFLQYDYQEGEAQTDETYNTMRAMFSSAPLSNPDGASGVRLHIKEGESIPSSVVGDFALTVNDIIRVGTYSGFLNSPEYGGGGVPPIYKWLLNFDSSDSSKRRLCGGKTSDGCAAAKGYFGWTATGVSGLTAALEINLPAWDAGSRESARSFVEASNASHELGHLLGLMHHGVTADPAGDTAYKSIMSYAYSHFGLPGDGFLPLHHIDYSRSKTPTNLDWRMGSGLGALTFVMGQDGEVSDFYANASDDALPTGGDTPVELSEAEATEAASPASLRGLISAYKIPASPSFPTLSGATVNVTAGTAIDIDLKGADPAGAKLSYVLDSAPELGAAKATDQGVRYTARADASGEDQFLVRAVNGKLGSDPATVIVRVQRPATNPGASGPKAPAAAVGGIVCVKRPTSRRLTVRLRSSGAKHRLGARLPRSFKSRSTARVRVLSGCTVVATGSLRGRRLSLRAVGKHKLRGTFTMIIKPRGRRDVAIKLTLR